jgi:hypothetical protein
MLNQWICGEQSGTGAVPPPPPNKNTSFGTINKDISLILCNKNQLDALFILNLFRQSISLCYGHIYCPSLGGIYSICTAIGTCYTFRLLAAAYLLMIGNKYARNM